MGHPIALLRFQVLSLGHPPFFILLVILLEQRPSGSSKSIGLFLT